MDRLKCLEASRADIAKSLDNRAALAESFVGGLALQYGMDEASKWAEQMLAWKHNLPAPVSDEEKFRIEGGTGTNDGKGVAMKEVGGDSAPLPDVSQSLPAVRVVQPARTPPPGPKHAQIKTPQNDPNPIMQFQIPVQEPTYDPAMHQAGPIHSETAETAGAAMNSTEYNASSFYPISSSRPPQQIAPDTRSPASPQAAAPILQQSEAVSQTSGGKRDLRGALDSARYVYP
ncbi:hypothetical protein FRC01_010928 [Tulasnella sp. 417]|nr:hypothetical protein FRC01_010928 [Tulasnella sp. 417]